MCTTRIEINSGDCRMTNLSTTCPESENTMTAKQRTLAAIRALVDHFEDDERRDYQELVERGEGSGHIYESIVEIQEWLNGEGQTSVLYMAAGSDVACGLPEAYCKMLTAQEATERFQSSLKRHCLPPIPYNPETDHVLAVFEPSDAMGHNFFGFTPMATETPTEYISLTYERPGLPLDRWRIEINGAVVYQEPDEDEEEEETDDGEQKEL